MSATKGELVFVAVRRRPARDLGGVDGAPSRGVDAVGLAGLHQRG